jgi:hypothetical protein
MSYDRAESIAMIRYVSLCVIQGKIDAILSDPPGGPDFSGGPSFALVADGSGAERAGRRLLGLDSRSTAAVAFNGCHEEFDDACDPLCTFGQG